MEELVAIPVICNEKMNLTHSKKQTKKRALVDELPEERHMCLVELAHTISGMCRAPEVLRRSSGKGVVYFLFGGTSRFKISSWYS